MASANAALMLVSQLLLHLFNGFSYSTITSRGLHMKRTRIIVASQMILRRHLQYEALDGDNRASAKSSVD